ncbi:MAG: hypothetical protein GXY61_00680 [Lentisphaerae bacterium]|nr:hypothetical protein [Lentisphaerota bacterium]
MITLQNECLSQTSNIWFATFDDRPARLFDGLEHIRATVFTGKKGAQDTRHVFATSYNRWYSETRDVLFNTLCFADISDYLMRGAIPKIGQEQGKRVRDRLSHFKSVRMSLAGALRGVRIYFHNAPQYWIRAMDFAPYFWNERAGEQLSTQVKTVSLSSTVDAAVLVAALNSSLFYWWFIILSDCRHLNMREIETFPLGLAEMPDQMKHRLSELTRRLSADLKRHKNRKECQYKTTGRVVYDEFYPKHSKSIIDQIDEMLATHYGFTDEELDFIINYDIKYRMGRNGGGEGI